MDFPFLETLTYALITAPCSWSWAVKLLDHLFSWGINVRDTLKQNASDKRNKVWLRCERIIHWKSHHHRLFLKRLRFIDLFLYFCFFFRWSLTFQLECFHWEKFILEIIFLLKLWTKCNCEWCGNNNLHLEWSNTDKQWVKPSCKF